MTSKYPVTLRVSWTGDARLHVQPKKYITCQPSIDACVVSASRLRIIFLSQPSCIRLNPTQLESQTNRNNPEPNLSRLEA